MEKFKENNKIDAVKFDLSADSYIAKFDEKYSKHKELLTFFEDHGGASFDKGIFKIHSKSSAFYWTDIVTEFFPKYKNRVCCFAFDWMGRQFAIDLQDVNKNYLFDPATGEDFELEQSLDGFFNEELVDYRDDTLASDDFAAAMHNFNLEILKPNQCIGYKKLLFLGGEDNLNNTEIIDMDVYWDLNYKIYSKINGMEEGSIINTIKYRE